jgi:DNA-binding transcriptional regulator YdaS (Cro superfamily)
LTSLSNVLRLSAVDTTKPSDALERATTVLTSQAAVAAACGYADRRNVSPWYTLGRPVPEDKCPLLERATAEKGQPVFCEELRPDLTWRRVADPSWPWHPKGKPLLDLTPEVVA